MSMASSLKLTPTEKKIYAFLEDGKRHRIKDVLKAMGDGHDSMNALRLHIWKMRKKIAKGGLIIIYEQFDQMTFYRLDTRPDFTNP